MGKSRSEKTPVVAFDAVQCPNCRSTQMEVGQTVSLAKLKMAEGKEWQIDGTVRLVRCLHGKCCNCGLVLDAIKQEIPVQFTSMRCAKCDKAEHLKCEVRELQQVGGAYKFKAVFTCTHCGNTSRIQKLLKYLWSIIRLKVSLTGVEIELDKNK